MESTWSATEASHTTRMARSRAAMKEEWDQAWSDLSDKMEFKWDQMTINLNTVNKSWEEALAFRTNAVEMALAKARAAIDDAFDVK